MIKTVNEIKDLEDVKEFEAQYAQTCSDAVSDIMQRISLLPMLMNAEFVNIESIKAEIQDLVMNKLEVKIPERYFRIVVVASAECAGDKLVKKKGKK